MTRRKAKHHVDDRRDRALHLEQHWAEIATRHRAEEARNTQKGHVDDARFRREAAEKAELLAKRHGLAAERLAKAAARARTARRLNDQASAERVTKAAAAAARTPSPARLSPKEQKRAEKIAAKKARLAREGETATRREQKAAQVDHDQRTAAGQREIAIRGPAIDKRASLTGYGSLIARQSDRKPERLLAMERYDTLVHRALQGEIASPKYERGVDTSAGFSDVPTDRAAAREELDQIRAHLGVECEAILRMRIFDRMTFAWMESQGYGEAERIGVLYLFAVDSLARYYGLSQSDPASAGSGQRLGASAMSESIPT